MRHKIITFGPEAIKNTVKVLHEGGLVIFPSDTVFGALVDATNSKAVSKLIAFKARPPGKPISVFVSGEDMMNDLVRVENKQKQLLHRLLPGPFTIILPSRHTVVSLLESEKGTLGIRIPSYRAVVDLVKVYGKPLTATSANLSGRPAHYSIEALFGELPQAKKDMVALAVDVGKLPRNKPSTIVDLTGSDLKVLRRGDVMVKDGRTFLSRSLHDTGEIAKHIVAQKLGSLETKPLVFILEGDMGVGKTVFVKAAGELFGVKDIISPTFVIYYEYSADKFNVKHLVHCDLFNIEEPEEFKHLGLEEYLNPGNIMFIEWGEKAGSLQKMLEEKSEVVYVQMKHINENEREITISS